MNLQTKVDRFQVREFQTRFLFTMMICFLEPIWPLAGNPSHKIVGKDNISISPALYLQAKNYIAFRLQTLLRPIFFNLSSKVVEFF